MREQSVRRAYETWHERLEVDGETDTPWRPLRWFALHSLVKAQKP